MKENTTVFARLYAIALGRYLKHRAGASLRPSARLGNQAVVLGLETLELARIHEQAIVALKLTKATGDSIERAEVFFNETNARISKTHSDSGQSKGELIRLNKALLKRTQKLAANQILLQRGFVQRKGVEQAMKKSSAHHTKLLKESLVLQDNLRKLTHQLLSQQENEREEVSHRLQDEIAQTLLGINVRLLCLKQQARSKSQVLKNEIANTQRLVLKSAQSVRKAAQRLRTR